MTYYASPEGSFDATGTALAPWSLDRASQSLLGIPAPSDTILLLPGVYADPFELRLSGAPGAPVTFAAEGSGSVIFDGSRLATNSNGATAAPPETGFTLVNGDGILHYADGGNSGGVGLVYRLSGVSRSITAIHCDAPTDDNWRAATLWNTRTVNINETNPAFRLHDTDPSHNDLQTFEDGVTRIAHDWKGQYRQNLDALSGPASSVDARLTDAGAAASHSVWISYAGERLLVSHQHDVVIDGGSGRQILFTHAAGLARLTGCRDVVLSRLLFSGSGGGDAVRLENCARGAVTACGIDGAGSAGDRSGSGIQLTACEDVTVTDNALAHCAVASIRLTGSLRARVAGNLLSRSGAGILCDDRISAGHTIEENPVTDCGGPEDRLMEMAPEAGITLAAGASPLVRRNNLLRCGFGIALGKAGPKGAQVLNNTVKDSLFDGIRLEQTEAALEGALHDNLLQNNLVAGSGRFDLLVRLRNGASHGWFGNQFRFNCFAGNRVCIQSTGDEGVNLPDTDLRTAASQAPELILSGNLVSDPLLASDLSIPEHSPCVDAGRSVDTENEDLMGLASDVPVIGQRKDIGSFEYGTGGSATVKPTAALAVAPGDGSAPLAVTFQIDLTAAGGTLAAAALDYGDGSGETIPLPALSFSRPHTYTGRGRFTARLTATDSHGGTSAEARVSLHVTAAAESLPGRKLVLPAARITASSSDTSVPNERHTPDRIADCSGALGNVCDPAAANDLTGYWRSDLAPGSDFPHYLKIPLSDTGTLKTLSKFRFSPWRWEVGRTYVCSLYRSALDLDYTDPRWVPVAQKFVTSASADADPLAQWTELPLAHVDAAFLLLVWHSSSAATDPEIRAAGCWEAEPYGIDAVTPPVALPPHASLTATQRGVTPLTVSMVLRCEAPSGSVRSGLIDYGNGTTETVPRPDPRFTRTHTYLAPGPGDAHFQATWQVTDNQGTLSPLAAAAITVGPTRPPAPNLPPQASVSASTAAGLAPLAAVLTFTGFDPDGSVASGTYDFGDGTPPVTVAHPAGTLTRPHTYATAGSYTASYTVIDNQGKPSLAGSATILAVDPPAAPNLRPTCALAADVPAGTGPLAVIFTATSADGDGTVAEAVIDYGDGSGLVTVPSPAVSFTRSHTYGAVGSDTVYVATLTVTDNAEVVSTVAEQRIAVGHLSTPATPNQAPLATIGVRPTAGLAPLAVSFSLGASDAGGVREATFDPGDGSAPITFPSPSGTLTEGHSYGAPGRYTASYVATDTAGLAGRVARCEVIVAAPPPPPVEPARIDGTTDSDGNSDGPYGARQLLNGKRAGDGDATARWSISLVDRDGNPREPWGRVQLADLGPVGRVRIAPLLPDRRSVVYRLESAAAAGGPWVNVFADGAASHVTTADEWTEERFSPVVCQHLKLVVLGSQAGGETLEVASFWALEAYPT